jgi:hypothetical protein
MPFAHFILLTAIVSASADGSDQGKAVGLSKAEVSGVVRAHMASVKWCFERALTKNATLNGTVVMNWSVEPDGRVSEAIVASSTLNDSDVERCIVRQVAHWTFPKSSRRTPVAAFPFAFKRQPPAKSPADAGAPSLFNPPLQTDRRVGRFAPSRTGR